MTVHAPPQFTPAQILMTGQRAEAEGRHDFAVQFFRHLTEHYPQTHEAAVAHDALARLAQLHAAGPVHAGQPSGFQMSAQAYFGQPAADADYGTGHPFQPPPMATHRRAISIAPAEAARRPHPFEPPRSRPGYRTGRILARCVSWLGGIAIIAGLALLPVLLLNPRLLSTVALAVVGPAAASIGAGAAGLLVVSGFVMLVAGQLIRALFDLANASRDLAAQTRARAEHDSAEQRARKGAGHGHGHD